MKKILSIAALMVYIFSINTLVHASTMGFFSHTNNGIEMGHCQAHQQKSTSKTQSVDCCELAFSDQYSNTEIAMKTISHIDTVHILPKFNDIYINPDTIPVPIFLISKSPGRNTDIKYNKFSDLFGIIVQLS